jgi:hypothetical protein
MNQTFQIWDKKLWYAQEKILIVSFKSIDQQIFNGNWNLFWKIELHKFVINLFVIEANNAIQFLFIFGCVINIWFFFAFQNNVFFVLHYMFACATQPITLHLQQVLKLLMIMFSW